MDLETVRQKKSRPGSPSDAASDSPTRDYVTIRNPNSPEADSPEREVNVKADLANLANVKADETYVGGWSTPSSELASMSDNEPEVSRVSLVAENRTKPFPKKSRGKTQKKKASWRRSRKPK